MIYKKYVEYKSVLGLSNAKPHERDLPIYSNVHEREYKGLSIYPEVRGSATHSSKCILMYVEAPHTPQNVSLTKK